MLSFEQLSINWLSLYISAFIFFADSLSYAENRRNGGLTKFRRNRERHGDSHVGSSLRALGVCLKKADLRRFSICEEALESQFHPRHRGHECKRLLATVNLKGRGHFGASQYDGRAPGFGKPGCSPVEKFACAPSLAPMTGATAVRAAGPTTVRSEEHTSELQSLT